jgi:hypothetical protein
MTLTDFITAFLSAPESSGYLFDWSLPKTCVGLSCISAASKACQQLVKHISGSGYLFDWSLPKTCVGLLMSQATSV